MAIYQNQTVHSDMDFESFATQSWRVVVGKFGRLFGFTFGGSRVSSLSFSLTMIFDGISFRSSSFKINPLRSIKDLARLSPEKSKLKLSSSSSVAAEC
jgi:hypothetical protein